MTRPMNKVWSSYRRKQVNINKAVSNDEVSNLLLKHYKVLHSLLVRSERDEETFNDTYLKLTYNYNPDEDFIKLFKYYFKLLKGAYKRDDKTANYYLIVNDNFTNNAYDDTFKDEEPTVKTKLSELKLNIYAHIKKAKEKIDLKD